MGVPIPLYVKVPVPPTPCGLRTAPDAGLTMPPEEEPSVMGRFSVALAVATKLPPTERQARGAVRGAGQGAAVNDGRDRSCC